MTVFTKTVTAIQRTITLLGRSVTLRKHTGTTEVDASKPWLGETQTTSDFTDTTVSAVFEPFKFSEMDDTIVKTGDVKVFLSAGELGSVEPAVGDLLIDGSQQYRLMRVLHFKPDESSIAFELHARQC